MNQKSVAYIAPFLLFMAFTGLVQWLDSIHFQIGGISAKYLLFPVQTIACGIVLAVFWRQYGLKAPAGTALTAAIGIGVFIIWISPQAFFHAAPRTEGFDPNVFAGQPLLYWSNLGMRFLRLVLVVPLLEEIFWRGFLLRYLVKEDFTDVPFGTFSALANGAVTIGFMLEHSTPDWPAALITGLLYNVIAYRTRSLSSCVLAHSITNAMLGAFILITHQWGFW